MNYHYSMVIQWSEEDQLFLVHLPEFPWQPFHTHGSIHEEAAKNGQEVIEAFVEMLRRKGNRFLNPECFPLSPCRLLSQTRSSYHFPIPIALPSKTAAVDPNCEAIVLSFPNPDRPSLGNHQRSL